jgi:hypothetical protein
LERLQRRIERRGSLLIWLDKDMCWHGTANGKRGRVPKYSEAVVQFCLTIKGLFNLPLRQAMEMTQSLLELAKADWRSRLQHGQSAPEASFGDDRGAADDNGIVSAGRQHGHQEAGRRKVENQEAWSRLLSPMAQVHLGIDAATLDNFWGIFGLLLHSFILSNNGACTKPGAIQRSDRKPASVLCHPFTLKHPRN